jgi:hypothetical protein
LALYTSTKPTANRLMVSPLRTPKTMVPQFTEGGRQSMGSEIVESSSARTQGKQKECFDNEVDARDIDGLPVRRHLWISLLSSANHLQSGNRTHMRPNEPP